MILKDTLLCNAFVTDLNKYYITMGAKSLTNAQQRFIAFCINAMVMLACFNLAAFAVASFGYYSDTALSWMLHHSKIDWSLLLRSAMLKVFIEHSISNVNLIIDDTDRARSKVVKILWGVFKTVDKLTGGWINAQNIVFLCLVTDKVTIPFMFSFYKPDPKFSAWKKRDKKLRKKGIKKKNRPAAPKQNKHYPARIEIAMKLLARFKAFIPTIDQATGKSLKVNSISFDCAYMSPKIANYCKKIFPNVQTISQIKSSQIVWNRSGKKMSASKYFSRQVAVEAEVNLRGSMKKVTYVNARLVVKSHGKLLHVIALKYEGETEYRYLVATDLSWRSEDIIRAYALRWLIEVANFDWKQHDGWGKKAYQHGADGACRGVILSLLVDCFLLTHPTQLHQSRAGLRLWTAGSVVRRIQYDSILNTIEEIFSCSYPQKRLKELAQNIEKVVQLTPSDKHMVKVEISDLGPSPSLQRVWG